MGVRTDELSTMRHTLRGASRHIVLATVPFSDRF